MGENKRRWWERASGRLAVGMGLGFVVAVLCAGYPHHLGLVVVSTAIFAAVSFVWFVAMYDEQPPSVP